MWLNEFDFHCMAPKFAKNTFQRIPSYYLRSGFVGANWVFAVKVRKLVGDVFHVEVDYDLADGVGENVAGHFTEKCHSHKLQELHLVENLGIIYQKLELFFWNTSLKWAMKPLC